MKLKRTRLILAGALASLVAVAALALALQSHDSGQNSSPAGPMTLASTRNADGAPSYGDASSVAKAFRADASTAGGGSVPGAEAAGAPSVIQGDVGAQPAQLPDILGRKIVQATDIDVQVKEVPRSFQDIVRIATTAGGFVASSTFSNVSDDQQIADLTIRVPADQYQSVLAQVRGMGNVATEKSDATT